MATTKTPAAKLDAATIAKLKQLGITATTEDAARKALVDIMTKNEVPGVDDDPLPDLIDMAAVFVNSDEAADEEIDAAEEEEEEVVAPAKTTAKGKAAPAKKAAKSDEEEIEEAAEEVVGKGLSTKKAAAKPAAKKASTTDNGRRRKLLGKRWEDLTDAEKNKALAPFKKRMPEKQYRYELLQKSFTVKYLGKTSEQNILKYHLLRLQADGTLEGVFISHRFKTPEELADYLPDGMEDRKLLQGDSCAYIHPFSQEEVMYVLDKTDFLAKSVELANKQDKKMRESRAKLENQLEESKAAAAPTKGKPAAKPAPKAAAPVVEEEEEEEEVVPAPKKVAPAKKAAPVVVTKGKKK